MKKRQVQVRVLCEDDAHESFLRMCLRRRGYRRLRVMPYPAGGGGSGKAFVQGNYVSAMSAARVYRRKNQSETYALVVMIDRDLPGQPEVYSDLDSRLVDAGQERRGDEEPVAIFAPKYSVETWVCYLRGDRGVDETTDFSLRKYGIGTDACRRAGAEFADHIPSRDCPLPSLVDACKERGRLPRN